MKKKQILIMLLILEIALTTLFMATKNLSVVMGQICVVMAMVVYYVKK